MCFYLLLISSPKNVNYVIKVSRSFGFENKCHVIEADTSVNDVRFSDR